MHFKSSIALKIQINCPGCLVAMVSNNALSIDFDHDSRTVQREDTAFTLNFVHSVYVAGAGPGTS